MAKVGLDQCINIADLCMLARARLPQPVFDYLEGAAESEQTAVRNTAAFDDVALLPRCLVDVSTVQTKTKVLGLDVDWPLICSPAGAARIYHRHGELAVARAAERAGLLYALSTMSTYSLEEVASASSGPKLFQLYVFRDRGVSHALIERARAAGYKALCITVDCAVRGNREREMRSGLGIPMKLSLRGLAQFATHPGWFFQQSAKDALTMRNFLEYVGSNSIVAQSQYIDSQMDPSVSWSDIETFQRQWDGPLAIKGIMSVEDARSAVQSGASAVIVSNHGGRQLDGTAAAVEALPAIAAAVGDKIDVILDGGVRRGIHILKALALGAKACSVGRPYLYGLAAGGEPGVDKALSMLKIELVRAMQLSGVADVRALPTTLIRTQHAYH